MGWILCLCLSAACLVASVCMFAFLNKTKRLSHVAPFYMLVGGVFSASVFLFLPIYGDIFQGETLSWFKLFLLSVHNTIRLFVIDGEFNIILDHLHVAENWLYTAYSVLAAVLFVTAPLMTFGFILSFFKNLSAYRRYLCGFFSDAYIFSELNERSITLAESLREGGKRRVLVFTDVFEPEDETPYELVNRAKALGAACFKKDIQSVNLRLHRKRKNLSLFIIGTDEEENLDQTIALIDAFREWEKARLYVFSSKTDSELLLTSVDKGRMKVQRVDAVRALVYRTLYDEGIDLFRNALETDEGCRQIHAVLVGLADYGGEMLKALSWFCQMDGYRLVIDAFDSDPLAGERIAAQCPELMADGYNGVFIPGEAQYKITVHAGMTPGTVSYTEEIRKLKDVTYVLVGLPAGEDNLHAATELRTLFERSGIDPQIHVILHSSKEKEALKNICNFKGQAYRLHYIGDIRSSYSEKTVLESELEQEAIRIHMNWGADEDSFWKFEYNYRSSMAAALHKKVKTELGLKGANGEPVTEAERDLLETVEHRRWNAYMRSEGYVYSGSPDGESRNDLGKMHHNLVPYELLSSEDKRKDSIIMT